MNDARSSCAQIALLLFVVACGNADTGGSAVSQTPDASPPEDGGTTTTQPPSGDGGSTPPIERCNRTAPFDKPVALGGNVNTLAHSESSGWMSPDLRTLYFTRGSGPYANISVATRLSEDDPFGEPAILPADVNLDGESDSHPAVTPDGLRLVFGSARSQSQKLWTSTRADIASPWQPSTRIFPDSSAAETGGYLADAGRALYFFRNSGDSYAIVVARLGADGAYSEPVPVAGIPPMVGGPVYTNPVLTDDERIIYYRGQEGLSGDSYAIWRATRADPSAPFGAPEPFPGLRQTPGADFVSWVSDDDCVIVLVGPRSNADNYDLYMARRPR